MKGLDTVVNTASGKDLERWGRGVGHIVNHAPIPTRAHIVRTQSGREWVLRLTANIYLTSDGICRIEGLTIREWLAHPFRPVEKFRLAAWRLDEIGAIDRAEIIIVMQYAELQYKAQLKRHQKQWSRMKRFAAHASHILVPSAPRELEAAPQRALEALPST